MHYYGESLVDPTQKQQWDAMSDNHKRAEVKDHKERVLGSQDRPLSYIADYRTFLEKNSEDANYSYDVTQKDGSVKNGNEKHLSDGDKQNLDMINNGVPDANANPNGNANPNPNANVQRGRVRLEGPNPLGLQRGASASNKKQGFLSLFCCGKNSGGKH